MEEGKKRLAVMVGINYFNTSNELRGCINDVDSIHQALTDRFGFEPDNIEVITDVPGATVMPTGANIRQALRRMVDRAEPGDVLFFHYSGHGTLIPAAKAHHGGHAKCGEAIVPCDFNLITDVDFRQLVDRLPANVSFTIVSDSCHSGGLIDKEKEQIGPSTVADRGVTPSVHLRPKAIPFDEILHHVASLSSVESDHVGDHLFDLFGHEVSPAFAAKELLLGAGQGKAAVDADDGILLSGCQTNETSADAGPEEEGGKAYGAFSHAIQMVLEEEGGKLSNKEVVLRARELLRRQGFAQHPCLYCSDVNAEAPFLWQPEV